MAIMFRKRIKIFPGVTVNLSRTGVTTSIGVRGARVTTGRGQRRLTVGIPGTGISETHVSRIQENPGPEGGHSQQNAISVERILIGLVVGVVLALALVASKLYSDG